MLDHLIELARARGAHRVSLETGSMEAFVPARSMYAAAGFVESGPFGEYGLSPNSTFMTLDLGRTDDL
jgi:putative acetyltransferase